jgi:translation elongation factor EF-4
MNDGYRAYVTMMVWDITSEPGPHSLVVEASLKGARGALLIGDATRPETIDRLEQWYKRIEDPKDIEVVYMANKIDAATDRTAVNQRLKAVAGKRPYYMVSAKTGEYVETAVNKLAELLATRPSD